jgi:hypothetical protein
MFQNFPIKMLRAVLVIGSVISLASCGGGVCSGWTAIYPSKDDQLTDGTSRQILAHNTYGQRLHCSAFKPKR